MKTTDRSEWVTHPWVAEGQRRVRFGVFEHPGLEWPAAIEWAQRVEALGFDSYWVGDHPAFFPCDCWTRLAVLAQVTTRLRLGPLVSCIGYRSPVLLARQAADIDALSNGRLVLGVGIGDNIHEFAHLGVPGGSARERQAALEEATVIIKRLWSGERVTFAGQYVQVQDAHLGGLPVQQPSVPVVIAGGGEKITLRQVARHADASNFGPGDVIGAAWDLGAVRRKFAALRDHCATIGRPYASVLRTYVQLAVELTESGSSTQERFTFGAAQFERFRGAPRDAVTYFQALAEAGVQYFIVNVFNDPRSLRLLAEQVMPELSSASSPA